jgi:hypothetical protein
MNVDAIILTKSNTEKSVRMCKRTIQSLHDSESEHKFNVTLVESGIDTKHEFMKIVNKYLLPNEKFNYNRFINHALPYLQSDWVIISNNDVCYERGWFSEIMNVHQQRPDITSFSPKDPTLYMKYYDWHFLGSDSTYFESYHVTEAIMGWCLVIKKDSLDKIAPLDELFDMYYQDNDYAMSLQKEGIKHALCRHSIVCHLQTATITKLDESKMAKMKDDELKFRTKWNQ